MKLFSFTTTAKPKTPVAENKGHRRHHSPAPPHLPTSPQSVLRRPRPSDLSNPSPSSSSSSSSSAVFSPSPSPPATITRHQLERALLFLGGEESDVAAILAAASPDCDGQISLDELCLPPVDGECDEEEEELMAAFAVFDANGDGKISAEELWEALAMLGDEGCSIDECRRIIGVVDFDGDGFVGFRDFARMMAMQCP